MLRGYSYPIYHRIPDTARAPAAEGDQHLTLRELLMLRPGSAGDFCAVPNCECHNNLFAQVHGLTTDTELNPPGTAEGTPAGPDSVNVARITETATPKQNNVPSTLTKSEQRRKDYNIHVGDWLCVCDTWCTEFYDNCPTCGRKSDDAQEKQADTGSCAGKYRLPPRWYNSWYCVNPDVVRGRSNVPGCNTWNFPHHRFCKECGMENGRHVGNVAKDESLPIAPKTYDAHRYNHPFIINPEGKNIALPRKERRFISGRWYNT